MKRRSALLGLVLLAVLALVAPLTAAADPCVDCQPGQGCCSSSGCPCCPLSSWAVAVSVPVDLGLAWTGLVGEPPADRCLSAAHRDVFHVPKTLLA